MRPKEEVVGRRFGRLVVTSEVPITERKNRKYRECVCECDCGNTVHVRAGNLLSGNTTSCGCFDMDLRRQKALDGLIGKRFGRLTVIKESDRSTNRKIALICLCDCGNYTDVWAGDLRANMVRSCGCLRKEVSRERMLEDITGQTFNELTAIRIVEDHVGVNGLRRTQWLFKCSCGREIVAMPMNVKRGMTKSCGHIGKSIAEHEITEFLDGLGIDYRREYNPFDDLVNPNTGYKLKFDFVITNRDGDFVIIEHQGIQHFEDKLSESSKYFGIEQREVTDIVKKEYCLSHNIKLFETLYDEDYISHVKQILIENNCIDEEVRTDERSNAKVY